MPTSSSLIAKVNSVLTKFGPMDRLVYKRTVTEPSNSLNNLIGRYATEPTHVDVLLNPQPYYERLGRVHQPGTRAESMDLVVGNVQLLADDYEFLLSPTAISLEELENPNLYLVLKDSGGYEEPFRLLDVDRVPFQGKDVAFSAYYRSTTRSGGQ